MDISNGGLRADETTTVPAQAQAAEHLTMTHKEMAEAIDAGQAAPLAAGMPWVVSHGDGWWIAYEGRWLRVVNEPLNTDINRMALRLQSSEFTATRLAVLRRSLQILTDSDEAEGQS